MFQTLRINSVYIKLKSSGRALLASGFTNAMIAIAGLVTGIINARYLGLEGRGEFGEIVVIFSITTSVVSLSINEYFLVNESENQRFYSYLLSVLVCFLFFVIFSLAASFFELFDILYWKLFIAFVFFSVFNVFYVSVFLKSFGVVSYNLTRALPHYINMILYLWGVWYECFDLEFAVNALVASNLCVFIGALIFLLARGCIKLEVSISTMVDILKKSLGIHKVTLFGVAATYMDKVLILTFLSIEEAGAYFVGATLASTLVYAVFSSSSILLMSRRGLDKDDVVASMLSPLVLSVAPIIFFFFFGGEVVGYVFGKEFSLYEYEYFVLLLASIFSGARLVVVRALRKSFKNNEGLLIEAVSASLLLICSIATFWFYKLDLWVFSVLVLIVSFFSLLVSVRIYQRYCFEKG